MCVVRVCVLAYVCALECVCVQLLLWDVRLTVWLLLWKHSLPGKCHEIASSDFTEQTDSEVIVSDVSWWTRSS